MKKLIFILIILKLSLANGSEHHQNIFSYEFHPHTVKYLSENRSLLGFDFLKHLNFGNQSVDIELDLNVEESFSEQDFHGSVSLNVHNSFLDIHLKAILDTGEQYLNRLASELSVGKEIEFLENYKISPELHVIKIDEELEADVSVHFSREI